MKSAFIERVMEDFAADVVDHGIMVRFVADSNLAKRARVMYFVCVKDIGHAMKRFKITVKHLEAELGRRAEPSFCTTATLYKTSLGVQYGWSESRFDECLALCVNHWCDDHLLVLSSPSIGNQGKATLIVFQMQSHYHPFLPLKIRVVRPVYADLFSSHLWLRILFEKYLNSGVSCFE